MPKKKRKVWLVHKNKVIQRHSILSKTLKRDYELIRRGVYTRKGTEVTITIIKGKKRKVKTFKVIKVVGIRKVVELKRFKNPEVWAKFNWQSDHKRTSQDAAIKLKLKGTFTESELRSAAKEKFEQIANTEGFELSEPDITIIKPAARYFYDKKFTRV